jgi:polysaccharide biosynthesis protein PslE
MKQENSLQMLKRQAVAFLLVAIVGIGLTAGVVIFAPRTYQSNAKFLLRLGRENVSIDPTASTTGDVASLHRTRESEVQSAVDGMRSRRVLENVLKELGPEPILNGALPGTGISQKSLLGSIKGYIRGLVENLDPIDDAEKAIITLKSGLQIDAEQDSSVIDVGYKTKTPEMAQLVVDTWVRAYQEEHGRINTSAGSFEFFQKQQNQLLQKLEDAREKLQVKKSDSGVLTIDGGQHILERQMEQARLSHTNVEAKLAGANARLASLLKQQEKIPARMTTDEAVSNTSEARQQMRERLFNLEIEERGMAGKFDPEHPALVALRRQLEDARRIYEKYEDDTKETLEGINPVHVTISEQISLEQSNVEALRSELSAIDTSIESLTHQFNRLNKQEAEMKALQRQVDVLESQYQGQFVKLEQARLGEELQRTNISNLCLIQDPSLERRPVSPNKVLCALLGSIGSFLAAAGFVVWREARFQLRQVNAAEKTTVDAPANPVVADRRSVEPKSGGRFTSATKAL